MVRKLVNYFVFQAGWLTCVWSAGAGLPWLGPVAVAGAVALHLAQARRVHSEAALLGSCAVIGLAYDSLLLYTGWLNYPNGHWIPGLAPYWMVALWVLFATTLNLSMAWLRGRVWTMVALGAAGGPLSYLAGQKLGAISLLQPEPALAAIAIGWGLMMPMLAWMASKLDGFAPPAGPGYILTGWRDGGDKAHA